MSILIDSGRMNIIKNKQRKKDCSQQITPLQLELDIHQNSQHYQTQVSHINDNLILRIFNCFKKFKYQKSTKLKQRDFIVLRKQYQKQKIYSLFLYQDSQMRRRTKIIIGDIDTNSQEFALFKQFNDLVNSYQQIQKQEMKGEHELNNFNQRLLQLLGSDLSQILEKEIALKQEMISYDEDKINQFPSDQG